MASNERSLGWNTTTVNDGATTYDSSRMIAMEQKTLGNGTLKTGGNLAITYATSTLTIADGAALINGYFYESTTASTIPTSTLNGTYTLALIANASGGSYTVARSTADTTTVLTSTVRMALATSAQLTTIGAANYISYATVIVGATGLITSVTQLQPFAIARQQNNTQFIYLADGSVSLPTAGPQTVANYTSANNVLSSTDGTITANATTGAVTIAYGGMYSYSATILFDNNTTGTRVGYISNSNVFGTQITAANLVYAPLGTNYAVYQFSGTQYSGVVTVPFQISLQASASVASRSVLFAYLSVTRL